MRREARFSPSVLLGIATLAAGTIVAGCGGGGHSALPPTPSSIGQIVAGTKSGTLSIKVQLPSAGTMSASSVKRSPQYVSGATQGVYITGTCVAGGGTMTQNCTGAAFPPVYADVSSSSPLCTGSPRVCTLSANPVAGYSYAITVAAVDSKPTASSGGYGTGFGTTANMLAVGSQPPPLPAATGSPAPSPTPTNLGQSINRGGVNSVSIYLNAIATQFVQVNPVSGAAMDNVIVGTASGNYQYPTYYLSAGDLAGNLIASPTCMNTYAGENGTGAGATIPLSSYPTTTGYGQCDNFAGPDGKEYALTVTSSVPTHVCTITAIVNPNATPPPCGSAGTSPNLYDTIDFAPITQSLGVWTQAPPGVLNTSGLYWDGIADDDSCTGTTPKCGVPIPLSMTNAVPTTATPIIGKTSSYNVVNTAQFYLAPFVSTLSCGTSPGCAAVQTQSGCTGYCPQVSLSNGTAATMTVYLYGSGGTNNFTTNAGCYGTVAKCFAVAENGAPPANASPCYTAINQYNGLSQGSIGCNVIADPLAGTTYPTGTADCLAPPGAGNAGTVIAIIKPGTFTKGSITAPGAADSMTFTIQAVGGSVTGYCNFQVVDPNRSPYAYSLPIDVQVSSTGTVITVPPIQIFPPPSSGATLAYVPVGTNGIQILSPAGIVNTIPVPGGAGTVGLDDSGNMYVDSPYSNTGPNSTITKFAFDSTNAITTYQPSGNAVFAFNSGAGELIDERFGTNGGVVIDVWDAGSSGGPPSRTFTYPTGLFDGIMAHDGTIFVPYISAGALLYDVYAPGASSPTRTIHETIIPPANQSSFSANYSAVGSDGTLYITEWTFLSGDSLAGLYVYPTTGNETYQQIGTATAPLGPEAVDLDGSGNVYVTNSNTVYDTGSPSVDTSHSIIEFSPHAATRLRSFTGNWTNGYSLVATSDGELYVGSFLSSSQIGGTYWVPAGGTTGTKVSPLAGSVMTLYNGTIESTSLHRSTLSAGAAGGAATGGIGPLRLRRH